MAWNQSMSLRVVFRWCAINVTKGDNAINIQDKCHSPTRQPADVFSSHTQLIHILLDQLQINLAGL